MLGGGGKAPLLRYGDKAVDQGKVHGFTPKTFIINSTFKSITRLFPFVNPLGSSLFVSFFVQLLSFIV